MLPEVHGFDIARRIKGTERYGHIPIVMVSAVYEGWRFAEDVKTSYGVDAYLEKPFKIADLVAAVEARARARGPRAARRRDALRPRPSGCSRRASRPTRRATSTGRSSHLQRGDAASIRSPTGSISTWACSTASRASIYDAIQELETALDINGQHFPALKNLAVLYQKAGLPQQSHRDVGARPRVAPDDPTRQSIKEHLLGLL